MERRSFLAAAALVPIMSATGSEPASAETAPPPHISTDPAAGPASLLRALRRSDFPTAETLLRREPALALQRNADDETPYRILAREGFHDAAAWLASNGFKPDIFDLSASRDTKAFDLAFNAYPGIVNVRDRFGRAPLDIAAAAGSIPMVEALVGRGATLDARNPDGMTALGVALRHPDARIADEMAWILLANGADPNHQQAGGDRPLHLAARSGNSAAVRRLVRRGADTAAKDASRSTAADIGRRSGDRATLAALQDKVRAIFSTRYRAKSSGTVGRDDTHGLPQNYVNQFVVFGHFNLNQLKEMLGRTPDLLNTRASWDELAVEGAAHVGFRDGASFLVDKGAPVALGTAITLKQYDLVKAMLRADRNALWERGPHDYPLVWYPVFAGGDIQMAELLLAHGADFNESVRGQSALHHAASRNQVEFATWLLGQGADPRQVSRVGFMPGTPAEIAQRAKHGALAAMLRSRS